MQTHANVNIAYFIGLQSRHPIGPYFQLAFNLAWLKPIRGLTRAAHIGWQARTTEKLKRIFFLISAVKLRLRATWALVTNAVRPSHFACAFGRCIRSGMSGFHLSVSTNRNVPITVSRSKNAANQWNSSVCLWDSQNENGTPPSQSLKGANWC